MVVQKRIIFLYVLSNIFFGLSNIVNIRFKFEVSVKVFSPDSIIVDIKNKKQRIQGTNSNF